MPEQALANVKVLEFAEMTSAPYCGKRLADMGAEVVKIEKPGIGDPVREKPPFPKNVSHPQKSGLHLFLNSNKKSITLDVSCSEGLDIFHQLIQWADILISDKRPDILASLGIGYENLLKIKPGLIIASITPYGLTGPKKNHKMHNLNVSHAGGVAILQPSLTEFPDRQPVKPGGYSASYDGGVGAELAVLAALFYQRRTGKGQIIDVSEQEIQIDLQRLESVLALNGGNPMNRFDDGKKLAIYCINACADGMVCINAPMEDQFQAFKKVLDSPLLSDNPHAVTKGIRIEHVEEFNDIVTGLLAKETVWDLTLRAQAAKVPITPVLDANGVLASDHLNDRGFFVKVDDPEIGTVAKFPGAPYKMSKTPWQYTLPAPCLGQHNTEMYAGMLGMNEDDIQVLKGKQII